MLNGPLAPKTSEYVNIKYEFSRFEWQNPSKKQKELEDKDAARREKAAEKAALLAEEDASLSAINKLKPTKKKGKDDFDMLNG